MGVKEKMGLTTEYVNSLMEGEGFALEKHEKFILGFNNLYVFRKKDVKMKGKKER